MSIAERFLKRAQEEQTQFYPGDIVKVEGEAYVKNVPYIVMRSYFSKRRDPVDSWITARPINVSTQWSDATIYLNDERPVLLERSKFVAPPKFNIGQEVTFKFVTGMFLGHVDGISNEAESWRNGVLTGKLRWNYCITPIDQLPDYPRPMNVWIPESNIQLPPEDDKTELVMA